MEKENFFMEKIKNESIKEFQKCIDMLNSDNESKKSFYYFLYHDLFEINEQEIIDIDIYSIIQNPEYILTKNIDDIIYKIKQNNTDNLLFNELKKKIIIDKKNIKSKIKECVSHTEIIKKIYIDTSLKKYLPINHNTKFIYDNKKVLNITTFPENNLILGNFFTRFMFIQIGLPDNSINSTNNSIHLFNDFYSDEKINSYIDSKYENIKNFNEIHMNFKYWIIMLIIINNIFSKQSNFDIIFNKTEFKNHIKKILNIQIKKEDDIQNKNKKIVHSGGGNKILNAMLKSMMVKKKPDNKKQKKNSKNELIKIYERLFNIIYINKTINLNNIYVKSFNKNMIKYFINKIEKDLPIANKTRYTITLPFIKGDVQKSLSTIINLDEKKRNVTLLNKNILFDENNMKFNIFNFLHVFLNDNNQSEINNFISKIKNKLILLIYYLYDLKKNLYIKYIELINYKFNINNIENKKKLNKNTDADTNIDTDVYTDINTKNTNTDIDTKNTNTYTKNKFNKKSNSDLNKIKKEIKIIKNKKNIENSDEKILEFEDQYRQLIIKKYMNKYTNINSNLDSNK